MIRNTLKFAIYFNAFNYYVIKLNLTSHHKKYDFQNEKKDPVKKFL